MFCHQCEHEWYQDESNLACPECHSEFCELIEAHDDPREDNAAPAERPWSAPDPDEDDIDHFPWQVAAAPGELPGIRARDETERPTANVRQVQGGFTGLIGSAIQGLIGGILQPPDYSDARQNRHDSDEDGHHDERPESQNIEHTIVSPNGTTMTRQFHGNGFHITMTSSRNSGLAPRNARAAQPFQRQPETIDDLMFQMLSNIGAVGPGMPNNHPFGAVGPPGLFQLLGLPLGGVMGDAVYSQEGLDRIISQLMEQHQTGNAPGPATRTAIENLPTRKIVEKDFSDDGNAECSICMEAVELGTEVTVLPCQHWFHAECVGAWLGEHDTCPHCRKGIMPEANDDAASPRSRQEVPFSEGHNSEGSDMPGAYPPPRRSSRLQRTSSDTTASAGVFSRMREAFGSGGRSSDDNRRQH